MYIFPHAVCCLYLGVDGTDRENQIQFLVTVVCVVKLPMFVTTKCFVADMTNI